MTLNEALKHYNSNGVRSGINWTWATFPTEADAEGFVEWCDANAYETSGVYSPSHVSATWDVRYR